MAFAEFADKVLFRHPEIIDGNATGTLYEPLKLFGFPISSNPTDRKAFVIFLAIVFVDPVRRPRTAAPHPLRPALDRHRRQPGGVGHHRPQPDVDEDRRVRDLRRHRRLRRRPLRPNRGALSVDSFPMFAGLPLVLLLAVQGVRFPGAGFMAVLGLASFPALLECDQPLVR